MPEINRPANSPIPSGNPVYRPNSGEMTGGVREGVNVTPVRPGEVSETRPAGAPGEGQRNETAFMAPRARPITAEDIRGHLIQIQIPDTDFNIRLSSMMLRYGVELSRDNFQTLQNMLEGTHKGLNMQEAALVLLGKGIHNSAAAVAVLGDFLAQNPQLAAQLMTATQMIANLQTAMAASQSFLNPTLTNELSGLLAQFEKGMGSMGENYLGSRSGSTIDRADLLNDLRALRSLLQAMQEKALSKPQEPSSQADVLRSTLMSTIHHLDGTVQNLIAQALLSQASGRADLGAVKYLYHQIPNMGAKPPQTVEILIQKEGSQMGAKINPANTQVVLSLETEQLGKIAVTMGVKDKTVGFLFNTQRDATRGLVAREGARLRHQVQSQGFLTRSFQVRTQPTLSTIRPYLIPLLGLDDLMRVDARI